MRAIPLIVGGVAYDDLVDCCAFRSFLYRPLRALLDTARLGMRWSVVLAACGVIFGIQSANAQDERKTITLDGNPDFTISIPAIANNMISDPKNDPDHFLFIMLNLGSDGELMCSVSRTDYPQGSTPASVAAAWSAKPPDALCGGTGPTQSGLDIVESGSFDHDGMSAAVCTGSYADTAQKLPGRVKSHMGIAAPGGLFSLACESGAVDQEEAESDWMFDWFKVVEYMQESLRLPR
jgi:hypothetical protein